MTPVISLLKIMTITPRTYFPPCPGYSVLITLSAEAAIIIAIPNKESERRSGGICTRSAAFEVAMPGTDDLRQLGLWPGLRHILLPLHEKQYSFPLMA